MVWKNKRKIAPSFWLAFYCINLIPTMEIHMETQKPDRSPNSRIIIKKLRNGLAELHFWNWFKQRQSKCSWELLIAGSCLNEVLNKIAETCDLVAWLTNYHPPRWLFMLLSRVPRTFYISLIMKHCSAAAIMTRYLVNILWVRQSF